MDVSVFADVGKKQFKRYNVELQINERIMGSLPLIEADIAAMIRRRVGATTSDDEIKRRTQLFLSEMYGVEAGQPVSEEQVEAAVEKYGDAMVTAFRTDPETGEFYVPSLVIKAALKEATSILFPWSPDNKWGVTKKKAVSYLSERVFIEPDKIKLGKSKPDGVNVTYGTVSGMRGERSIVTRHAYITRPKLAFTLTVVKGSDDVEARWPEIWTLAEKLGLGAQRSRGEGVYSVVKFEEVPMESDEKQPAKPKKAA